MAGSRNLKRTVEKGILAHAHEEVRVPEPTNSFANIRYRPKRDLSVHGVDHTLRELRLDSILRGDRIEVMRQLLVCRTNVALATRFESWTTSTTKDLKYVQYREIDE